MEDREIVIGRRRPPGAHRGRAKRHILALALGVVLVAAACTANDDDSAVSTDSDEIAEDDDGELFTRTTDEPGVGTTTAPPATPDAELPISITRVDLDAGTVTISNHGDVRVDLGGVWICEFPDCEAIDALTLNTGDSGTIPNPHASVAADGALALYRTDDYDDPAAILSYVEWGSAGHTRASVAVQAGVWGTEPVGAGLVLGTGGAFAADASGWSVLQPLPADATTPPPGPGATSTTSRPVSPPPDDYTGSPASTPPPVSPPPPDPPPDDYTPAPPPPPASTPAAPPPPPDEY